MAVVVLAAAVLGGLFSSVAPKPQLRIGVLLSQTGALSQYGPGDTKGAKLAVDQINTAGGVLGQPVLLYVEDDQTDQTAAVAAATKLITVNHVNAIVGAQFSGGSIPIVSSVAKKNFVPMVSPSATSPALSNLTLTGGYFFRTAPSDALQGVVAADYLYGNLSYRYIAIIARDDSYGRGLAGVVTTKFRALGGTINQTQPVIIDPSHTNFDADLTNLFSTNPQAVYFVGFPGEGITVMQNWQAGLSSHPNWDRPWIFAEGLKSQAFMDQLRGAGLDVTKIIGTAPVSPFGAVQDLFVAQYKANNSGQTPVLYTDYTYDAVYLIALAAQKAGSVNGTAIRDQLRTVSMAPGTVIKPGQWSQALAALSGGGDVNWEGAAGSEDFDANGDVRGSYEVWGVNSTFQIVRV
ncbi:MAG TPA: ABC transporter substrate-binding protein, partial [Thermoplasmata archaeon]|nr:ABC transporter substrate-binding protein [Thermoplasmata archaeon]